MLTNGVNNTILWLHGGNMKIKTNLRRIRFFKEMTQDDLAILSGYDQSLISRLERGNLRETPGLEKMKNKIADVLSLPLEEIFPTRGE